MVLFPRGNLPGMTTAIESEESQVWHAGRHGQTFLSEKPVLIDSTAADANNTPTTTLRGGLVMMRRDSDGNTQQYARGTAGVINGVLPFHQDMLDFSGAVGDRWVQLFKTGFLKFSELKVAAEASVSLAVCDALSSMGFYFDDQTKQKTRHEETITGDKTLTVNDHGKRFYVDVTGRTLTLPARSLAIEGFEIEAFVCQDAMTFLVASDASGEMIGPNNVARDQVTLDHEGSAVRVRCVDDTRGGVSFKWMVENIGTGTLTFA